MILVQATAQCMPYKGTCSILLALQVLEKSYLSGVRLRSDVRSNRETSTFFTAPSHPAPEPFIPLETRMIMEPGCNIDDIGRESVESRR